MSQSGASRLAPSPSDGELQILNILWDEGPCTVRAVHDRVLQDREVGYTTVLKLMQIMRDKGLVSREDARRPHVYTAVAERASVQATLLSSLRTKAFGGSAASLVMRALADRPALAAELAEIRQFLDDLEGN